MLSIIVIENNEKLKYNNNYITRLGARNGCAQCASTCLFPRYVRLFRQRVDGRRSRRSSVLYYMGLNSMRTDLSRSGQGQPRNVPLYNNNNM